MYIKFSLRTFLNGSLSLIIHVAYRDDNGKPWVLPVVRTVESAMAADQTLDHEYLPVAGNGDFRAACCRLLLGDESVAITEGRVRQSSVF